MRTVLLAALLTVKQQLVSRFFLVLAVVQPLLFLLIAAWLSGNDSRSMVDSIASTSVMGMWSTTLFGAGRALQRERRYGTLESLLVSPTALAIPLAGVCLGSAALGVVSAATGVVLVVALTGQLTSVAASLVFLATLLGSVVCMAALGLLMCALFVLLRQASLITNMLEYPVWFACGLLVPLASRPEALAVVGDMLTPTHIGVLLRGAFGSGVFDVRAGLATAALTVCYVLVAVVLLRLVTNRVRRRGDLTVS